MQVVLFSRSFPFGSQETFLEYEIEVLARISALDITIVPREVTGEPRKIPDNIKVDTSYASLVSKNSEKKVFPIIFNVKSILKALVFHKASQFSAIRDVASFVHYGATMLKWSKHHLSGTELLYTYWFDVETYGLSQLKQKVNCKHVLVTRAHGFDIYEENRPHGFIPFRSEILNKIDHVFCISEFGVSYLRKKYDIEKASCSYLGVKSAGKLNHDKTRDIVCIVSCSSLVAVKRIPLIIESIFHLAKTHPSIQFEWVHIGGEPSQIEKQLSEELVNLKVALKGQVSNATLHEYYRHHKVDVFINLSSSEGVPVSMMEAMSYGIPVVGTDVGGVSEIVNEENGELLNANPSIQEVADAILRVVESQKKGKQARATFEKKFNARENFQLFAKNLLTLAKN